MNLQLGDRAGTLVVINTHKAAFNASERARGFMDYDADKPEFTVLEITSSASGSAEEALERIYVEWMSGSLRGEQCGGPLCQPYRSVGEAGPHRDHRLTCGTEPECDVGGEGDHLIPKGRVPGYGALPALPQRILASRTRTSSSPSTSSSPRTSWTTTPIASSGTARAKPKSEVMCGQGCP